MVVRGAADAVARGAAVSLGIANLARYHVSLRAREQAGVPSWRSAQGLTRVKWTRHVFETEGWLYAIQSLRNAITANTFLASTVLTLFGLSIGSLWKQKPSNLDVRATAQLVSAAGGLICSAYSFSQSARLMVHAGFMFPVAATEPEERAAVERIMVRSHLLQWGGWRWLYLSAWTATWVLGGEVAACAASFALTAFLASEDRKPAPAT